MKRTSLICAVVLLAHTLPTGAAERLLIDVGPAVAPAAATAVVVTVPELVVTAPPVARSTRVDAAPKRSALLLTMYATACVLQSYDGFSTLKAAAANHVELNPMMSSLASHPGLVIAAKGAMTVATIAVAENLWRNHRRGQAIAMLIVSNGLMAAVGANNAMALRGER
jgi:hypothetical protein